MRPLPIFRPLRGAALALALALALPVGVGCEDGGVRVKVHLTRGDAHLDEGNSEEAALEYRSALQIEPNNPEAHWGLARAYLLERQFSKAYWELQETTRLAPHNLEAALQLGQFLLFGKDDELRQALDLAERVLAADAEDEKAWLLKARSLERLDRSEGALEAYRKAVEVAPDDAKITLQLANYLAEHDQREEAEELFFRLGELQPGFAAYAALGGFLARDPARLEEAEKAYRQALDQAEEGDRQRAYTVLANFLYTFGRAPEAEAVLLEGVDALEDDLELIYTLARFYNARGEVEKADQMILESTRADPGNPRPFLVLSAYRGQQGDLEGALAAAESALEAAPTDLRSRLRKAELLVDLGFRADDAERIAQGSAITNAVLVQDGDNPEGLFVKAKIDIAEGRLEEAAQSLRRALDARPDWAQAHFLLGSALYLNDEINSARASTVRALELDANLIEARRVLSQIHARMGEDELAVELGKRVLAARPEDPKLRILVAQSLVRLGRPDEAQRMIEAIPGEGRDAEASFALGRLAFLRRDIPAARAHFLRAQEKDPNRFEVLRSLFLLDLEEDGKLEASTEELIRAAAREKPDDARLAQLGGELALYLGKPEEAGRAFERAISLDPTDLRGYENLARYMHAVGRSDEVVGIYERALQENPDSGSLHVVLGSLYESQLRNEEAIRSYERALEIDSSIAIAKNNLAYLLVETGGSLDRALDLAQEAKELMPDSPSAADTLGWVLFKKKIPSAAIGYLEEAERGFPNDNPQLGVVRHHLALAYEANGEPDRAREALERALRDLQALQNEGTLDEEPAWASDLRAMLERLPDAEPVAAAEG